MALKTGLWIDHRKAILVSLGETGARTRTVESGVESRVRMAGGSRSKTPYGPQDIASESRRDARYAHHLDAYYDRVASELAASEAVFIMGPGEAKTELAKKLEEASHNRGPRIAVEPADKLTEAQLVEKVKAHFGYVEPM